ncbi:MAG: hypothetical protein AB1489_22765 [Acidobacteriota bacterium]
MININLWRAESLKTFKRPANLIMVIFIPLLGFFYYGAIFFNALAYGGQYLTDAQATLPFPKSFEVVVGTVAGFAKLMAVVFIANNVGSEYNQDTWKMILPRHGNRIAFLITKLFSALIAMIIFVVSAIGCWLLFAWLGALALNINAALPTPSTLIMAQLKLVVLSIMDMVFYGILAFMATVITRSVVGGILFGLIALFGLEILGQMATNNVALMLPSVHMNNIDARWLMNPRLIRMITSQLGQDVPIKASLLVLSGYISLFISATFYLFRRRDMAGS